jgi:hypothetical protein
VLGVDALYPTGGRPLPPPSTSRGRTLIRTHVKRERMVVPPDGQQAREEVQWGRR